MSKLSIIHLIFISVTTYLPHTAYIKMIDCWLIFSLFKPFVDTLVQTYIHTLREAPVPKTQAWSKNQSNRKIDFCHTFVRVVYPVFFLAFVVIFWLVGLIYYIDL